MHIHVVTILCWNFPRDRCMAPHVLYDFPAKIIITLASITESGIIGNSFLIHLQREMLKEWICWLLGGQISPYMWWLGCCPEITWGHKGFMVMFTVCCVLPSSTECPSVFQQTNCSNLRHRAVTRFGKILSKFIVLSKENCLISQWFVTVARSVIFSTLYKFFMNTCTFPVALCIVC